jgi:hypothetical protein
LRLQNVSRPATNFPVFARGSVSEVRPSDPVHPGEVRAVVLATNLVRR